MSKTDKKLQILEATANDKTIDNAARDSARQKIVERRELLTPIFKAAVTKFADLHDTTARMLAKGAINVIFLKIFFNIFKYNIFRMKFCGRIRAITYLIY